MMFASKRPTDVCAMYSAPWSILLRVALEISKDVPRTIIKLSRSQVMAMSFCVV